MMQRHVRGDVAEVQVVSDQERERPFVEIGFGGEVWAEVTDERPGEEPLVEFLLDATVRQRMELRQLEATLGAARQALLDLDEPRSSGA